MKSLSSSTDNKPDDPVPLTCLFEHRGRVVWAVPQVAFLSAWDTMHQCEQKSREWLSRRKYRLTASQLASVIGTNPYQSREETLRHYTGVGSGATVPFTGNEATRHGEKYEDEAISKYEKFYDKVVLCFGLMPFLYYGDSFLGGSVDGITTCGHLIEAKCPFRRQPKDTIPVYYEPQIQSMMHGFGLRKTDFIEYVPESLWCPEIHNTHLINIDNEFMTTHYTTLREFWYRVERCREGADRSCFMFDPPPIKKKRKKQKEKQRICQISI